MQMFEAELIRSARLAESHAESSESPPGAEFERLRTEKRFKTSLSRIINTSRISTTNILLVYY
jgi:hypothetical protein